MALSPRTAFLAGLGLVSSGLVAVVAAQPVAAAPTPGYRWCSVSTETPCVEHLYVDGVEKFVGDPVYNVSTSFVVGEDNTFTGHVVVNGSINLPDTAPLFQVVYDAGPIKPRVVTGNGSGVTVARSFDGARHHVTVTGRAVYKLWACRYQEAVSDFVCPETAPAEDAQNVFGFNVGDGAWWGKDPDQVDGLELFSNIDITGIPPEYDKATGTLTLVLNNAHQSSTGVVFQGAATLRIPNRFVREVWEVPDPPTMTSSSVSATLGQGTGSVSIAPDMGGVRIDLSGVTFSERVLQVKLGRIKPTKPVISKTKRLSSGRGRIAFVAATPRGAKVRGYEVKCVSGGHVARATGKQTKVVVGGLRAGQSYQCQVRAKSKAGFGKYSKKKLLKK